ncbi:zinc metalloproteinase nas-13-like [Eurytemora carolleeae]|uniref:zinc metalloproteinase nas-13-like n=1 Tax=Eurytemora carolleeae TaxID=1294199 RepID=UPI000C75C27D|nr:zinc metalloproteinase nas-13-like [Eurytemora carolleeae]|eukprot:XP_023325046.1 zinc metalloproteinase nas-13-like [Eurytemora affinis]
MKNYHDNTCIRFQPRISETAYIHIVKGTGCSSSIGRTGSAQAVSLGNGCVYTGIVMHELMHATGFWHEQSRADRDNHIRINWSNIIKGMEFNFLRYNLNKIDHLGADYDTCSIMHYGEYAFSKARDPTIVPLKQGKCQLGQKEGFSDTDIRKLNTFYQCSGYPQVDNSVTKPEPTTTVKPWVKPKCEDQNQYCTMWAKAGECKQNPRWMLVYCPFACNQCKVSM